MKPLITLRLYRFGAAYVFNSRSGRVPCSTNHHSVYVRTLSGEYNLSDVEFQLVVITPKPYNYHGHVTLIDGQRSISIPHNTMVGSCVDGDNDLTDAMVVEFIRLLEPN